MTGVYGPHLMDITDSPKSPETGNVSDTNLNDNLNNSENGDKATINTANNNASLFVGKLAFDCRTKELEELFGKYGRLTRCDIKRGFAFVEFEDEKDAEDAMKYLDGTRFLGMNITVERTKGERRANTNPDGSKNRECFKCGKVGHYARECRSGGGRGYRDERRVDRYDRYSRDYQRRSPIRRDRRDYSPARRDRRDYSPVRRYSRSPARRSSRSPVRRSSRSPVRRDSRSPRRY